MLLPNGNDSYKKPVPFIMSGTRALYSYKALVLCMAFLILCALGARGDNPPAMRVDGNILIKPPSRGILTIVQAVKIRWEDGGGYGPEGLQPVAYEVECKF